MEFLVKVGEVLLDLSSPLNYTRNLLVLNLIDKAKIEILAVSLIDEYIRVIGLTEGFNNIEYHLIYQKLEVFYLVHLSINHDSSFIYWKKASNGY